MTHGLFIFNARLLDEAIDGPGAILVIEGKIRTVFRAILQMKILQRL